MPKIVISKAGVARLIYSDDLRAVLSLGKSEIRRASHVEPTDDGRWTADLSPSGGPVLGPFERRADALAAEISWIEERGLE